MADRSALGDQREIQVPNRTSSTASGATAAVVLFVHGFLVDGSLLWRTSCRCSRATRAASPRTGRSARTRGALRPDADLTPAGLARHIVDTLDALDIERATLVGNDSGGALSRSSPRTTRTGRPGSC